MNILLIGSGGREHALAWKMAQSNKVNQIFVAPGNAGTAQQEKCTNVSCSTIPELLQFAKKNQIDLTVVGPEALLVNGIADVFEEEGLRIFAPNKRSAHLEGSKTYAKDFMQKYGVKTAGYKNFTSNNEALTHLDTVNFPVVVKASGLAAGKGVLICQTKEEAKDAVNDIMLNNKFGSAGAEVVIEEFLIGFEASILSICDGHTILPFISAKDHKKIGKGETGLNTGGMGVVAPNPMLTEEQYNAFITDILEPTLQGIKAEGLETTGVIFFGLMVNENGVYLLEYNMRFGDPETQAVLPLLNSDIIDVFNAAIDKKLSSLSLDWKNEHSCCVVAVSGGYPEAYEKGKEITIEPLQEANYFIAGAKLDGEKLLTSGGRVLNVVATAATLEEARTNAYSNMERVTFEGKVIRTDIGC